MYETITTNIMVKNIKETIRFYEEKLGFRKILSVPEEGEILNFAILNKDKISIMLHKTFYGKDEFAIFDNNNNILTISC